MSLAGGLCAGIIASNLRATEGRTDVFACREFVPEKGVFRESGGRQEWRTGRSYESSKEAPLKERFTVGSGDDAPGT